MISVEEARRSARIEQMRKNIGTTKTFEQVQEEVMDLIDSRSNEGVFNGFYYCPSEEMQKPLAEWLISYGFKIAFIPRPADETAYYSIIKIDWAE